MKMKEKKGKNLRRTVMTATLIIGVSTLMFQGLTQVAVAGTYDKKVTIPTSYVSFAEDITQEKLPEGYTKADYKVGAIDLEYYKNNVPTEKDLTKEDAAERAARYIWQIYGADLEGQTIEMGYSTNTDVNPHATWDAEVFMKDQDYHDGYSVTLYEVIIDSVTGELFSIGINRRLEEKVNAGPDYSIDESETGEFALVAKEFVEKYDIVHGDIESITCTGQGASFSTNEIGTYGDPTLSYEIHGTNGEVAFLSISRYDKMLLNITFNGQAQYDLIRIEEFIERSRRESALLKQEKDSANETRESVLESDGEN